MATTDEGVRKRLVAEKGQCKRSLTRLEKYLAADREYRKEDLQVRIQSSNQVFEKYKGITLNLELIGEKGSEDDDTEDRYLTLLATLEGNLMRVSTTPEDSSKENSSYISSKLPCLEIPIYDGKDVSMYKFFIEMFRAIIHFDSRISDI